MNETQNLFILAGVWTLIVAGLVFFIPKWSIKILVFALLVGIPFWELPYGYYNFRSACQKEATLQVFEKTNPQDSICVEDLDSKLYEGLTSVGFKQIEVLGGSDDQRRDGASGRVIRATRGALKSKVCLAPAASVALPWRISREDTSITSASDGHIVARQSRVLWFGMWWQDVAHPMFGRGGFCYDDPIRPFRFVRYGVS